MTFLDKAKYAGPRDEDGVILFDYYFDIGRQYNPLAVAQYGLGHYNLYLDNGAPEHLGVAITQADWLVKNLEENNEGLPVWRHKFPWHYKQGLAAGWYSAHSQGTGISLLGRMYKTTGDEKYLRAAREAFRSMNIAIANGGVKFTDGEGNIWLEEYIIDPPTHILNGFLWALWGVWDYWLLTKDEAAFELWNGCIATLKKNLPRYDAGFWSLYDLSRQALKMIASPFYHSLHIVQLEATYRMSQEETFRSYSEKFAGYASNHLYRIMALFYKAVFKIFYF
jgi:hypothetical protein